MQRHRFWILICLLVLLIASSCASSPDLKSAPESYASLSPTPFQLSVDSPAPIPTFNSQNISTLYPTAVLKNGIDPTPAQVPSSADTLSVKIDPLTGLPPADPSLLQRRPLAIKVENYPRVYAPASRVNSCGCCLRILHRRRADAFHRGLLRKRLSDGRCPYDPVVTSTNM